MLAIHINTILHPNAIKVGWTLVNVIGYYYVNRNLREAHRNLTYLEAGGWNGFLRVEARSAITAERLRLVAVGIGTLIGVFSFFVLDRPAPNIQSELFAVIAGVGIIIISGIAVLNSYLNIRKVDKMMRLHGVDTKAVQPDYSKE